MLCMQNDGENMQEIANTLGKSASTISRVYAYPLR